MAENDADRNKNRRPKDFLDWLGLSASPDWKVARPLGRSLSVFLALLFILAFVAAFATLCRLVFGGNAGFGAGALVVAVLGAPFVIWNTYIRHRTLEFQKEGHITDRLAKAVEQLGTEKTVKTVIKNGPEEKTVPNIEVRIGGLLSLERIAQDSVFYDKGRDHVRVMEIICAYIRENAPARNAVPIPTDYLSNNQLNNWRKKIPRIRQDIMLALNILSHRSNRQRRIEAAYMQEGVSEAEWPFESQGNLSLRDWKLAMMCYKGYRLDLRGTCLQGCNFFKFKLGGAIFENARFDNASFTVAELNGTKLNGATLFGAKLQGATLNSAQFHNCILTNTQLNGATLNDAVLNNSQLDYVFLQMAQLKNTKLMAANLKNTKLNKAELGGALLDEADLSGADLRLCENLTVEQIQTCSGDAHTCLPEGMPRPEHWPRD